MILRYDVHDSRPGGSASLQTTQCTKRSTVLNRTSLSLLLTSVPGRLMEREATWLMLLVANKVEGGVRTNLK